MGVESTVYQRGGPERGIYCVPERGGTREGNLLCTREGPERGAKTGGRYVGRNTLNTTNQIVTSILDNPGAILLLNWDIPRSLRLQQIKLAANCFN